MQVPEPAPHATTQLCSDALARHDQLTLFLTEIAEAETDPAKRAKYEAEADAQRAFVAALRQVEKHQPFAYFDGVKVAYVDARLKYRQLLEMTRGHPNELRDKAFSVRPDEPDGDKVVEACQAADQLVLLVRELFNMAPFQDGRGAYDEHCWAVWDQFCAFMSEQKKSVENLPISSSPTEPPPVSSPATASTLVSR